MNPTRAKAIEKALAKEASYEASEWRSLCWDETVYACEDDRTRMRAHAAWKRHACYIAGLWACKARFFAPNPAEVFKDLCGEELSRKVDSYVRDLEHMRSWIFALVDINQRIHRSLEMVPMATLQEEGKLPQGVVMAAAKKWPDPEKADLAMRHITWRIRLIMDKRFVLDQPSLDFAILFGMAKSRKVGKASVLAAAALVAHVVGRGFPSSYKEARETLVEFARKKGELRPALTFFHVGKKCRAKALVSWGRQSHSWEWIFPGLIGKRDIFSREEVGLAEQWEAYWPRLHPRLIREAVLAKVSPSGLPRRFKRFWRQMRPQDLYERPHAFVAATKLVKSFGLQGARAILGATGLSLHDAGVDLPAEGLPHEAAQWVLERPTKKRLRLAREWKLLLELGWKPEDGEEKAFLTLSRHQYQNTKPGAEELALECARWGYTQEEFEAVQDRWLKAIRNWTFWTIPAPGGEKGLSLGGLRLVQLSKDDLRTLFAGEYTGCCQHPRGVGASCAWHAVESPDGAVWAIFRNNRMIAQSWVWRTQDTLVVDNIEALGHQTFVETIRRLYKKAASSVIGRLGIKEVIVGKAYSDVTFHEACSEDARLNPPAYSDARGGVWRLSDERDEIVRLIRDIERRVYPKELRALEEAACWADLVEYCEAEPRVLVLGGKGYVIATQNEVVDVAYEGRLPQKELFRVLSWLKEHFGTRSFKARLREATSYRLVRALAARGKITMKVISREVQGGETFYNVDLAFNRG